MYNDNTRPLIDFSRPADYTAVCDFTDMLISRYPFLSVSHIGESVLGRRIIMITLGNEEAEKSVLYVGAHHGMEWICTLVLFRFINEYCEYYKNGKSPFGINIQNLFQTRCIRIVPQLNPDGVQLQIHGADRACPLYDRLVKMSGGDFSHWQANARGVDLNHNYNSGFTEYKRLEEEKGYIPGPTRYSGICPESEPETGALASLIRYSSDNIRMILTLHTQGEEIFYTSGGVCPPGAESIGKKLSSLCGYKLSKPDGCAAYGGLTDWFIEEFNRPSFTIECGKGENPLPQGDYFRIYAGVREMLFWAALLI